VSDTKRPHGSAQPIVAWAEIEREAGAGDPIEVYQRFAGRRTDELSNGRPRPITVTVASFTRHLGISSDTFTIRLRAAGLGGGVVMSRPPTAEQVAYLARVETLLADFALLDEFAASMGEFARDAVAGPPTEAQVTAFLRNRDRDPADPTEREAACAELAALEIKRMVTLIDPERSWATHSGGVVDRA
jgi:hypothetical protein